MTSTTMTSMTTAMTNRETNRLHRWAMWRMTVNEGIISCIRDNATTRVIYPDSNTSDSQSLATSDMADFHEFPFITPEQMSLARKLNLREKYGSNHGLSDDAYFIFGLPRINVGKDIPEVTSTGTRSVYESFSELGETVNNNLRGREVTDNNTTLNMTYSELGPTPDDQSLASHDMEVQRINGYREEGWKSPPPPVPRLNLYSIQEEFNNNAGDSTTRYLSDHYQDKDTTQRFSSDRFPEEETTNHESSNYLQRGNMSRDMDRTTNRYLSNDYAEREAATRFSSKRYREEEMSNPFSPNHFHERETTNRYSSNCYGEGETTNRYSSNRYGEGETTNRYSSNRYGEEETTNRYSSNRYGEEETTNHYSSNRYGEGETTNRYSSNRYGEGETTNRYSPNQHQNEMIPTYSVREVIDRYESANRYASTSGPINNTPRETSNRFSFDHFNMNARSPPESPRRDIYPPFSSSRQNSHSPTRRSYSPLPSSPRHNYSPSPTAQSYPALPTTHSRQSYSPLPPTSPGGFPSGGGQGVSSPGYGNKMRPTRLLSDAEAERMKRQAYYDWSTPTTERYITEFASHNRYS